MNRRGKPSAAVISGTENTFGAVDVLVNNAGIQFVAKVEEFPVEKWDAVIATNLSASFHTCRSALPGMKQRGWGRIINIASAHGLRASAEKAAYVAAKHGLVGLTKVVALETANHGITCNAICPGWVMTPLVAQQSKREPTRTSSRSKKPSEHSWPRSSRWSVTRALTTSARSRFSSPVMQPPPSPAQATQWTAAGPRGEQEPRTTTCRCGAVFATTALERPDRPSTAVNLS
jgi:NAD(P)-dependent dehydrogenase (short-subunit alcohol dehydrogenase family)